MTADTCRDGPVTVQYSSCARGSQTLALARAHEGPEGLSQDRVSAYDVAADILSHAHAAGALRRKQVSRSGLAAN